jgi:hypothetical protein
MRTQYRQAGVLHPWNKLTPRGELHEQSSSLHVLPKRSCQPRMRGTAWAPEERRNGHALHRSARTMGNSMPEMTFRGWLFLMSGEVFQMRNDGSEENRKYLTHNELRAMTLSGSRAHRIGSSKWSSFFKCYPKVVWRARCIGASQIHCCITHQQLLTIPIDYTNLSFCNQRKDLDSKCSPELSWHLPCNT